jgi:hypothetical protein
MAATTAPVINSHDNNNSKATSITVLYLHAGNGRSGIDHSSPSSSPWALALQSIVTLSSSSPSSTTTTTIKSVHIERMDTSKYDDCYQQQIRAISSIKPDLIIGKTFGGALAMDIARKVFTLHCTLSFECVSSKRIVSAVLSVVLSLLDDRYQ